MKVIADVLCKFQIEYEADTNSVAEIMEEIQMDTVDNLINLESEESIQMISIEGLDLTGNFKEQVLE